MVNWQVKKASDAINAARRVIADPNLSTTDVAKEAGLSRGVVGQARLILERGTAQQLADALEGKVGISHTFNDIRAKLNQNDLTKLRTRGPVWTPHRRENLLGEASLWGKLGPALRGLSELPNPHDVIAVVRKNAVREAAVVAHLDAASQWMEEFANAWHRLKGSSAPKDPANAGNGDAASGAQHAKPAA